MGMRRPNTERTSPECSVQERGLGRRREGAGGGGEGS